MLAALCYTSAGPTFLRILAMPPYAAQSFIGENLLCIRGERLVFEHLNFSVSGGGAMVLSGPNGSGKSSLLRMMAGLLPPVAGTLSRDGVSVADDPEGHRTSLHYVGHLDAVKSVLTVAENVSFWAGLRGDGTKATAALKTFGLVALAATPARLLSAGQRRRLNLARIAASDAPLWLLDEPAVGLDRSSVAILVDLIAGHRARGGIVILSTHTDLDVSEAQTLELDAFAAEASG